MVKDNWNYSLLSEVCQINPGRRELQDIERDTEVSFLPMAAVSEDGKIISPETRKLKEVIKGFTYFRDGDVLVAKITPCFENGKRAIAKNLINGIGFGSTEFHVLRPKERVSPDWIFYAISKDDFRNTAKSQMTGTAGQKRVPRRVLEGYKIPVPDPDEQKEITDTIEAQFTRLEATIKSLNVIKKKLEVYQQCVMKAAFAGTLVENCSFEDKRISDFCKKVKKLNPKDEDFADFLYIDIGAIDNHNKKIATPKIINSDSAPSRARQETFPGDVIYSTVRVYLKNIAIVPESGDKTIISSTGFTVLRPDRNLSNKYLFYYLQTNGTTQILNGKQRGTSYPAIRDNDLFELSIKVPERKIQDKIVDEIESRFSVIDKVSVVIDTSLKKAERLRKSILKAAFEGRLVN